MKNIGYQIAFTVVISILSIQSGLFAQTESTWNGYRMLDFEHNGKAAKIVFPKEVNQNRNWIWRARFWGHEPQTDIALLKLGFHVVHIDVSDLFGAPEAVKIWNGYYEYLRKEYQLSEKVALEGLSRGGLIIYNWAAANPEKVACLYGDAPVCDINSWPGGKGAASVSEDAWKKCLLAYNLTEEEASGFRGIPVYTAEKVAKAGIPVLHVVGNADKTVPIEENTYKIQSLFRDLQGDFKLIEKEGIGHHPHSLVNPKPIVKFILEHTDPDLLYPELLEQAERTVQFRTNLQASDQVFRASKKGRVAFLGGSITFNPGWRDQVMSHLKAHYPETEFSFIAAGISSMGSTPGSFRLEKDVLSKGKIDLLFVEAAVNDDTNGRSPKAQVRGMEGIVRHALLKNPMTDIIMMHFVDPGKMSDYNNGKTPDVILQHEKVAAHYNVTSINLAKEVNDRILNGEFSWKDDFKDLHPSPFGQDLYGATINWSLDSLWEMSQSGVGMRQKLPVRPLDIHSYYNGHFLNIKKAKKRSGWTRLKSWNAEDGVATRSGFVDVPALEATEVGSSFSLDFTGRGIGLLVAAGPDVGKLEYSIDGSYYKTIDQFTKWSTQLHLPWLYILEDELRAGPHHLVIRVAEGKNEESSGHAARIFQFAIN